MASLDADTGTQLGVSRFDWHVTTPGCLMLFAITPRRFRCAIFRRRYAITLVAHVTSCLILLFSFAFRHVVIDAMLPCRHALFSPLPC